MGDPAAELERDVRALRRRIAEAERESALDLLRTARQYSSGPFSTRALIELDRPFARRHGTPKLQPEIINRQSGAFEGGWELREDGAGGWTLVNTDPKAGLVVAGSRVAFARPLPEAVAAEVEPRRRRRLKKALETAES